MRQLQQMAANGLVPGGAGTPTFGSRRHSFDSEVHSQDSEEGVLRRMNAQLYGAGMYGGGAAASYEPRKDPYL